MDTSTINLLHNVLLAYNLYRYYEKIGDLWLRDIFHIPNIAYILNLNIIECINALLHYLCSIKMLHDEKKLVSPIKNLNIDLLIMN